MNIDRQRICAVFTEYTDKYNSKDTKIKLKIDHTFRVAMLSEQIALSEGLSENDVDLAWLIGMLHDIGRFEQVRRYNTFSDALSIDHAQFGADLLFKEDLFESYLGMSIVKALEGKVISKEEIEIIETAVRNHSAYRIVDGLPDRYKMFCNIIRDADKIDILRVNAELPLEEIYNVTTQELLSSAITDTVLEAFYEEHAVLRSLKKTPVDNVVGHTSLVYELVYDKSIELVNEQGYIYKLMDFASNNPDTVATMKKVKNYMKEYIENRIGNNN